MKAACDIFYGIYGDDEQSIIIKNHLRRVELHPLCMILLATTASHNACDYDQVAKGWDIQWTRVSRKYHNRNLAATLELLLASPAFRELGPDARELLGVVAFFPQGIDEKNLDWLLPTASNGANIFDKFCALSLTHRSDGLITMLAPIRDYFRPQDPSSSPLLLAIKDRYFGWLSVDVDPDKPGFEEARWIAWEDINTEHLLDVFTSTDPYKGDTWDACYHFIEHLYWHKPRQTLLGLKIKALAECYSIEPRCLSELSRLFGRVKNHAERKRLLTLALGFKRREGEDHQVAQTLKC